MDARLARIHLRGGLLTLARAELETMAGLETLDREALADLAEARWRSGDLVGGGEAARAHLEAGGSEPLAMVVAVEALAAEGRFAESRQLAARVVERAPGLLDRLFAGQPRSLAWAELERRDADHEEIGTWGLLSGGDDVIRPGKRDATSRTPTDARPGAGTRDGRSGGPATGRTAGRTTGRTTPEPPRIAPRAAGMLTPPGVLGRIASPGRPDGAASPAGPGDRAGQVDRDPEWGASDASGQAPGTPAGRDPTAASPAPAPSPEAARAIESGRVAGREVGAIEEAIEHGEIAAVAARLSLLLRIDRALAPVILSLADRAVERAEAGDPAIAAVHLVRGDAYRTLGREAEATAAFERSRLALDASPTDEEPT